MKPAVTYWISRGEQGSVLVVTEDELVLLFGKKCTDKALLERIDAGECTEKDLNGALRLSHDQVATIEYLAGSTKLGIHYIRDRAPQPQ